jgi:hypothetical protein
LSKRTKAPAARKPAEDAPPAGLHSELHSEGYALRELFEISRARIVFRALMKALHENYNQVLGFDCGRVRAAECGLAAMRVVDALEALEEAHEHLLDGRELQKQQDADREADRSAAAPPVEAKKKARKAAGRKGGAA